MIWTKYDSVDKQKVISVIVALILFYLLTLAISTIIYSKISSIDNKDPVMDAALKVLYGKRYSVKSKKNKINS